MSASAKFLRNALAAAEELGYAVSIMEKPLESFVARDQQPIGRVVGKRQTPPIGALPNAQARAAMTANANYRTRAPKGIFFYSNHQEMDRDRERWTIEAIVARHAERG